jgi:hypothetical protein
VRGPGPVVVYTSARIAIFVVVAAVLAVAGMRGVLLLAVAVVVSGLLSFVMLGRQRDAMSQAVVQRGSRLRQRMQEATEAEDEIDDQLRAADQEGADQPDADRSARSGQREPDADQDGER